MAVIGSTEAKAFGVKTCTRVEASQQTHSALALRGGDLGPLTADTAAKALVVRFLPLSFLLRVGCIVDITSVAICVQLTLHVFSGQGFQVVNGYPLWQATEGTLKAWGINEATSTQELLAKWTGFNGE